MRVWDPLVRLVHWGLVAAFVVAWFSHGGYLPVHRISGYVLAALVVVRVAWGFAGPAHARFSDFVVGPAKLAAHLRLLLRAREPRYVGHNPAGGVMIVLLLALLAALCATGIVLDTPRFRDSGFKEVHDLLTDAALVCIVLHVVGVAHASWRHRENLVAAMFTGRKRESETRERHRGRLIDHLGLVVRDFPASKAFYTAVFEALAIPIGGSDEHDLWADELFISARDSGEVEGELTGRHHLAFQARDRAMVDAFYEAALAHGGKDNGPPGERTYHPGYYAAYVLDPDGNNIEAVTRGRVERSAASVMVRVHIPDA